MSAVPVHLAERMRRSILPPDRCEFGWAPFFSLIYLLFLFMPWSSWKAGAPWVSLTLLSIAVFLPLYFKSFWHRGDAVLAYVFAIAAIGLCLMLVNASAGVYVIYSAALIPWAGRRMSFCVLLALGLIALYALEMLLLGFSWTGFVINTCINLLVGMPTCIGNYYGMQTRRKNYELKLSHDEVRRLAAMAERERIGRDLHDLLGHTLSLIALKSELADRLIDRDTNAARVEIREVHRIAREALAQVRTAVTGIRAACLAGELASARLLLESSGTRFIVERLDEPGLSAVEETALAFALREAATNAHRYAKATRLSVELRSDRNAVNLSIVDDGRGGIKAEGNGLSGMRERLEALGGSLLIESALGKGTRLSILLPLHGVSRGVSAPTIDTPPQVAFKAIRT